MWKKIDWEMATAWITFISFSLACWAIILTGAFNLVHAIEQNAVSYGDTCENLRAGGWEVSQYECVQALATARAPKVQLPVLDTGRGHVHVPVAGDRAGSEGGSEPTS